MREIAHIRATMLGRFALQQTGMKEPRMVSLAGRSGRLWTLVAYLILHRDRGVPAQELIDLLWPDGSGSNPASTLQNNASRARNAMATLGFSDTKGMIRYENGLYRWVPGTDTWLDVDVFEDLARRALETSDPEELRTLGREAADLYQGDFLPDAADELWCADLHAYYRSLFVRLFRRLVQELMRTQEYAEAAALCAQAVHLDPLSEEFNLLLMQNLTRSHQAQQALDHYEALQKLYQESYGLTPSPELEAARLTASQELYGGGMGPAALETFLLAGDGESRALACDNGTFREIVLLYLRSMRRDPDLKAQLLMLCLEGWEAQPEKNAVYMQQLKLILQSCLRSGDPFTQIGAGQYWVLLPGAGSRPIAPSLSGSSRRCTSVLPKAAPSFGLGPSICGAWSIWPNPKTDTPPDGSAAGFRKDGSLHARKPKHCAGSGGLSPDAPEPGERLLRLCVQRRSGLPGGVHQSGPAHRPAGGVDEHRHRQSHAGKTLRCGGPRRCGAGGPAAPALQLAGAAP